MAKNIGKINPPVTVAWNVGLQDNLMITTKRKKNIFPHRNVHVKLGTVPYTCNVSMWKNEARGSL